MLPWNPQPGACWFRLSVLRAPGLYRCAQWEITRKPAPVASEGRVLSGCPRERTQIGHPNNEWVPGCRTDSCFLRGELVQVHRVVLGAGWSTIYTLNLSVSFFVLQSKEGEVGNSKTPFPLWATVSVWLGIWAGTREKRDEANSLWWWIFLVGFFCFNPY